MIKFEGRIVQFGFGAVGKSFFEKIEREIQFDETKYVVITRDAYEFDAYVNLGGMVANFVVAEVTRDNFKEVFSPYLVEGDLLIDFADTVGTKDICDWCAKRNIMYLNTGETDWPDHWYSIFEENEKKNAIKEMHAKSSETNRYPIVLQHGNNPGLVSHFVKAAIEYISSTQNKKDKYLKQLIKAGKFNEAACHLGIRMIHVNDMDLQEVKGDFNDKLLISPWCTDSFWFEMLSEATFNVGTHEKIDFTEDCNVYEEDKGFLEFKKLAVDKQCRTYYPMGTFDGYMVPHEETITIAKSLEVKEGEQVVYRPTVMFLYSPCKYATEYLKKAKVDELSSDEKNNGKTIIRGYAYPDNYEILYQEKIKSGTEYVGVLLLGDNFDPVWVGNRVETSFLNKDKKSCYWQTPTITPVAMSALAALCWMLKNKEKGGIYFPDDIKDYSYIMKLAEKYISKTIYKTFSKEEVADAMGLDFSSFQSKDIFVDTP